MSILRMGSLPLPTVLQKSLANGIEVIPLAMAFTLRTDDELEAALDAITSAEGISRQDAARRAILEKAQRDGLLERVEVSGAAMIERWGAVLDRLGSV